jgi:hypothetical protein
MRLGIDYAWGGPPPASALKRAGIAFVGRYFSQDPSKNIQAHEYQLLCKQGLDVKVAWETIATRAAEGLHAGRADALEAEAQRVKCGMPAGQVIYLAVDFEAKGPEIREYFRGAHSILGERTGAYGGYEAIKYLFDAGLIHHGWQTYAWSAGKWDPRALLRQYSNGHKLGGVEVDYDVQLAPPGGPYVPADEHNWIREYDRLVIQHRAPLRRAWLRRAMTRRRKVIRRLAQKTGWSMLNRTNRYHELARRTE